MDKAQAILTLCLVFAGLTGLFQWLFKQVTKEKIGFYDALFFPGLPILIRFVEKRTTFITDSFPQLGVRVFWFSAYVALLYLALRSWHQVKPKHAWIIVACWIPLVVTCILVWAYANPDPSATSPTAP